MLLTVTIYGGAQVQSARWHVTYSYGHLASNYYNPLPRGSQVSEHIFTVSSLHLSALAVLINDQVLYRPVILRPLAHSQHRDAHLFRNFVCLLFWPPEYRTALRASFFHQVVPCDTGLRPTLSFNDTP